MGLCGARKFELTNLFAKINQGIRPAPGYAALSLSIRKKTVNLGFTRMQKKHTGMKTY